MKAIIALTTLFLVAMTAGATTITIPGELQLYGKAEIELSHSDQGLLDRAEQGTTINSVFSRIGLKGNATLREDWQLVYQAEFELKGLDDEYQNQPLTARNSFIGIRHNAFGQLLLGRNDTRFKAIEGNVDQFKEREANLKQLFSGQDRMGDTATYIAPKIHGLELSATVIFGDDASAQSGETGYSLAASYGDSNLKKSGVYWGAAVNRKVKGIDALRLIGRIDLGAIQLGGFYQASEKASAGLEGDGFMVNVAMPLGAYVAKLQYSQDDSNIQHSEASKMSTLGLDYRFNPEATAYVMATHLELESDDDTAFSVGIKYFF